MKGRPRAPVGAWRCWSPVLPLLFGAACGGPQAQGDADSKCFRDDDCKPGLICVAPPSNPGNRLCSNDPSSLVSNVDGPPVAMGGDATTAGSAGAAQAGGGVAPVAGGGVGGSEPSAGRDGGGSGGTDAGGTNAGGTNAGGSDAGGSAGSSTAGAGGGGGSSGGVAGNAGTAPEGGAM